jgi:hypothetical protein
MQAERPEKQSIRDKWIDCVRRLNPSQLNNPDVPFYLTLCGASGLDVAKLIQEGYISLTSNGTAIAQQDAHKIVAIERDPLAVLDLQKKYPGLKILEYNFQDFVKGNSPILFPQGIHERYCRAAIVNLDFNGPLQGMEEDIVSSFPMITWINKLGQIHQAASISKWYLFLTINSGIDWSGTLVRRAVEFMQENFGRIPKFADDSKRILGQNLFRRISEGSEIDFTTLNDLERQRVLMLFVPKKISLLMHTLGYQVTTSTNCAYGVRPDSAPMVSWIFEFDLKETRHGTPDAIYRASVATIGDSAWQIDHTGDFLEI